MRDTRFTPTLHLCNNRGRAIRAQELTVAKRPRLTSVTRDGHVGTAPPGRVRRSSLRLASKVAPGIDLPFWERGETVRLALSSGHNANPCKAACGIGASFWIARRIVISCGVDQKLIDLRLLGDPIQAEWVATIVLREE